MSTLRKIIEYLTYLFVFLLPLQTRWIYKPGWLNGPWEYGTFSLYATEILLGILTLLSLIYLIYKLQSKQISVQLKSNKLPLIFISILLLLLLNCLLSLNPELAFYKLSHLIFAASIFFIIYLFGKLKIIYWTIISSAAIQTVFTIQQFFSQKVFANKWLGMANQTPDIIGVPVIENSVRTLRVFGTLPHPNILGGFLAIALIVNLIIYFQSQKKEKIFSLIFLAFNFIGLILTFSRSAIIAFFISAIIIFTCQIKEKTNFKKIITPVILGLSIVAIFLFSYSDLFLTRLSATNPVEKLSREVRLSQYHQASNIFQKHWFLGVGLGNYTFALRLQHPEFKNFDLQPVHNSFFLILLELGIPATIILFFLIILFLKFFLKIPVRPPCQNTSVSTAGITLHTCSRKTVVMSLLLGLICLSLLDHYLLSFYFGIILIALVFSLIYLNSKNQNS